MQRKNNHEMNIQNGRSDIRCERQYSQHFFRKESSVKEVKLQHCHTNHSSHYIVSCAWWLTGLPTQVLMMWHWCDIEDLTIIVCEIPCSALLIYNILLTLSIFLFVGQLFRRLCYHVHRLHRSINRASPVVYAGSDPVPFGCVGRGSWVPYRLHSWYVSSYVHWKTIIDVIPWRLSTNWYNVCRWRLEDWSNMWISLLVHHEIIEGSQSLSLSTSQLNDFENWCWVYALTIVNLLWLCSRVLILWRKAVHANTLTVHGLPVIIYKLGRH